MDINNNNINIKQIVENVIRENIMKSYDNIDEFILSATYKPLKKNLCVQKFVK